MAISGCENCGLEFECIDCGTQEPVNMRSEGMSGIQCGRCGAKFWIDLDGWDTSKGGAFR